MRESGNTVSTASMPAPNIPEMATPASTSVMRDAPAFSEIRSTSITPANAPRNAAKGTAAAAVGSTAQHSATPSPRRN